MKPYEARLLQKTDSVVWTWVAHPDDPPSPGVVMATNNTAVTIRWLDENAEPSVFFFDEPMKWAHIEPAPELRTYEPLDETPEEISRQIGGQR